MKICMMYPPGFKFGGLEVWVKEVSKRLEKRGHEIIFPDQKNIKSLKMKRLWYWFICRPKKSDVINLHDFNLHSLRTNVPVVSTYHGSLQANFFATKSPSAFFAALMEKIKASFSDINIVTSHLTQRWIKNSIYIPNGVDIKKFNPRVKGMKIKTNKIKVLWVGRKEWLKGYYDLPKITKKFYLIECFNTPYDEMPKYYNSCDVFVLPSHFESMPLTVLEAMACGKPVVAYDVGGLSDCVFNGVNGFLVKENDYEDFKEKIKLAYENRRILGKNGRKLCELIFNWDNVVEQYEIIFNKIVRG